MNLSKKVIIFCIVVIFSVIIVGGIYFYTRNNVDTTHDIIKEIEYITNDELEESDYTENDVIQGEIYIDVWRDNSMDSQLAVYSIGSGINEKIYLGAQPLHYLINRNGDIYTYQESSYRNKMTGKRDSAENKHIKTLNQIELESLENDLKSIIENNNSELGYLTSESWYVKINGNLTKVNVDLHKYVLTQYLGGN